MPTPSSRLTRSPCERNREFLRLFTGVELALKKRLRLPVNDRTRVAVLIDEFAARNAYWTDSANHMRLLAEIRNVLTHQLGTVGSYPVAVTSHSVEVLRGIKRHLLKPEPVSRRYCTPVLTVSADHSLASVLTMSLDNGFSQFPVLSDGRFGGLITGNEIIRWLGRRAKVNPPEVDLSSITVRTLLKKRDPFLKGMQIFHFASLDSQVEEVMSRFSNEPVLEVILLTQSGSKHTPLEGIITQWDAARYPAT